MKRRFSGFEMAAVFAVILSMIAVLSDPASAQSPSVSIFTDKDSYVAGETIEVSLGGENPGPEVRVDVYVGLLTPDCSVFSLQPDGWAEGIGPWMPDIELPAGFGMLPIPLSWFEIPCDMPPIAEAGEYSFASVLTTAGTFDWLCEASFAPFEVEPAVVQHYYVNVELGDDANDGSEELPWQTITHALESVEGVPEKPVEIHVAAGFYSSWGHEHFPLRMKSWVSIAGQDAETTILVGRSEPALSSYHIIYCRDVDNLAIAGFTIRGGSATGSLKQEDCLGGGICCYRSSPEISQNIIMSNWAGSGGWPSGGAGIYCYQGSPRILDNVIFGNDANWNGSGGGILTEDSSAEILNNRIEDNKASCGGGICCEGIGDTMVSYNTIVGNDSSRGAGICCSRSGLIIISNNEIRDNAGYGICCRGNSSPLIWNNTITANRDGRSCGGIACYYGSSPTISSNTIVGHTGARYGGGVYCSSDGSCSPTIVDCIIWDNAEDLSGCLATYCCIEDIVLGEGNIHEDPMFVSGPFGDYYLGPESPCVDAGSRFAEEARLSDKTTQIDGAPDTEVVDMGFHYPVPGDLSTDYTDE